MQRYAICLLLVCAGMTVGEAALVQGSPDDYAMLVRGSVSLDRDVSIGGSLGAGSDIWLNRNVNIGGDVHTSGKFGADRDVVIGGSVIAGGDVSFNRNVSVVNIDTTGKASLGRDVIVKGTLHALKNVSLNRGVSVWGDVYHHSKYWGDNGVEVKGQIIDNPETGPLEWVSDYREKPAMSSSGQGTDYYGKNEKVQLSPGEYGSLQVDKNSTVKLSGGSYTFNKVWFGQGVKLVADTSEEVVINVVGDLSLDKEVQFERSGAKGLIVKAGGNTWIGQNGVLDGSLYAWGGNTSIDKGNTITGQLYADGSAWLGQGVSVQGQSMGSGAVPEPSSLLCLAMGSLVHLIRRRR